MRGGSTLEIMLALAILALALTAAASVLFGNQSLALDIESTQEALGKAQAILEDAKAQARYDFNLLNPTTSLAVVSVGDYIKRATAEVSFASMGKDITVSLSTDIANLDGSEAGESCSSIAGDWSKATLGAPVPVGTSTITAVTSMRAADKRLYISTNGTHSNDQDFFAFDISSVPALLGSIDANSAAAGINSLAISSTTKGLYLYAASDSKPEVEVIDISQPKPKILQRYLIPTSTAPNVSGGHVNALVYKGGYVYIGLSKTTTGPEFVVLDASVPTALNYAGSYAAGAGISDIKIAHGVAYLATADNAKEVITLDISNPRAPILLSSYHPPGSTGFGGGNTLSVVGDTLYLGRTYDSTGPEWYALNISNPAAITRTASLDIGTSSSPQSVNGVLVRGMLSFIAARDSLQLWNIATATAPTLIKRIDLPALGFRATAITCTGSNVFVGGYQTSDNKGRLYKLAP